MINVITIPQSSIITIDVWGDIHGQFRKFNNNLKSCYDKIIFIAGDCGFGFNKYQYYVEELTKIEETCTLNNLYVVFVRGNHDDPSYFVNDKFNFKRIFLVPDYTIVSFEKENILCVGGGISIDRKMRQAEERYLNLFKQNEQHWKKLYWKDEAPIYDEEKLLEISQNYNKLHIVSHTTIAEALPRDKNGIQNWLHMDSQLEEDVNLERECMSKIFTFLTIHNVNIETWCYGHFHQIKGYNLSKPEVFNKTTFYFLRDLTEYSYYNGITICRFNTKVKKNVIDSGFGDRIFANVELRPLNHVRRQGTVIEAANNAEGIDIALQDG